PRRASDREHAYARLRVIVQKPLVRLDAGLALGLARAWRCANPRERARERSLPRRLLLLLVGEALPLLLEPRAVVALVRDAGPLVELEDPAGHVVEEVAVMGDRHHAAGVLGKVTLEPSDRIGVQMVRRLVE